MIKAYGGISYNGMSSFSVARLSETTSLIWATLVAVKAECHLCHRPVDFLTKGPYVDLEDTACLNSKLNSEEHVWLVGHFSNGEEGAGFS